MGRRDDGKGSKRDGALDLYNPPAKPPVSSRFLTPRSYQISQSFDTFSRLFKRQHKVGVSAMVTPSGSQTAPSHWTGSSVRVSNSSCRCLHWSAPVSGIEQSSMS